MNYSSASSQEREKVQMLSTSLSNKVVNKPVSIELYKNNEVMVAEIVKRYDQDVIKYFLVSQEGTVKACYLESLWEKELHKWVWGSKDAGVKP